MVYRLYCTTLAMTQREKEREGGGGGQVTSVGLNLEFWNNVDITGKYQSVCKCCSYNAICVTVYALACFYSPISLSASLFAYFYNRIPLLVYSLVSTADFCASCWFARSTAPGLGYGLIWNSGPLAVVSTPVLASPFLIRPVVHVPL